MIYSVWPIVIHIFLQILQNYSQTFFLKKEKNYEGCQSHNNALKMCIIKKKKKTLKVLNNKNWF